ncbi:hypothetical protein [Pseudofrankia sp. BMG5.36]|uniref:hypothetical protein n=1 Tax=Pseudofrankia sp. BMG5.36 TaxID=1834512 RepID=UPI0008D90DB6|nr:hypothetical protein [Pseudofrankia sp. BMG5.36]OHV42809.1 hypothetical protein BCD48_29725 [Pseudofrankia sp. BMG5.36]
MTTFPVVLATFGVVALAIGLMFGGLGGNSENTDLLASPSPRLSASPTAEPSFSVRDTPTVSGDVTPTGTASPAASPATRPTGGATPRRTATPSPSPDPDAGPGAGGGGIQLPPIDLPTCVQTGHGLRCH